MHLRSPSVALALTLLSSSLLAHGGTYRGPAAPAAPPIVAPQPIGPKGPSTPVSPAQDPVESTTGTILKCDNQLTSWQFWWEFNKHAYLGLRAAVHNPIEVEGSGEFLWHPGRKKRQLAPTSKHIHDDILPCLKRAIDSTEQRDIVSSCLIAMAKIGEDHKDFALVDVFSPRLRGTSQEVRESAALAMGISAVASEQALDHLVALSLDSTAGRELSGGPVKNRTSAFALYGLGLYANRHHGTTIQRRALDTMRSVLEDASIRDRNQKVAAIQGMGLLVFDTTDAASLAMLDEALVSLHRYYTMRAGLGTQLLQSNCANAIAKLIGSDHARRDEFCQLFASDLKGENKDRRGTSLVRASALALGQMCSAFDDQHSLDKGYSELLAATCQNHKDDQTRCFSLLALGQIGGEQNKQFLLRMLEADNKQLERPWAALALGVQAFARYKANEEIHEVSKPATLVGEALTRQLDIAKSPELVGALGVALGLARYNEAAAKMRQRIPANLAKEEQAGYLCLGLAMMRDRRSIETIQDAMKASSRRPWLLAQTAIALSLFGDKSVPAQLRGKFVAPNVNLATLSTISEALGLVGDRRSITPLRHVLHDENLTDLHRAFTAVSLGGIADRANQPWHAKISRNINYRAAVETLTNRHSGVLDIF